MQVTLVKADICPSRVDFCSSLATYIVISEQSANTALPKVDFPFSILTSLSEEHLLNACCPMLYCPLIITDCKLSILAKHFLIILPPKTVKFVKEIGIQIV